MNYLGFKYYNLSHLLFSDGLKKIPTSGGIYSWVFWKNFNAKTITEKELYEIIKAYSSTDINLPETFKRYKFWINVKERSYTEEENVFGLSNEKEMLLKSFINSKKGKEVIYEFFKDIYFSKPFYVGKANNLNSRIDSHLSNGSKISKKLDELNIAPNCVWVGYKITDVTDDLEISNILEEIMQKILKPGLTEKAG